MKHVLDAKPWLTTARHPRRLIATLAISTSLVVAVSPTAEAGGSADPPPARLLASGLQSSVGGAIGPDGALYVPEGAAGRIRRIDPRTGTVTTFADGLPTQVFPLGGVMDVAFVGRTAYALVTLVSPDVGGSAVDGIYRIDGPHSSTVIADLGAWSIANPPATAFDVPSGLQYALEPTRHGFLVSDGHHNRILVVSKHGVVEDQIQFDNVVPTGLAVDGFTAFVAETGAVPHPPEAGKVTQVGVRSHNTREIAAGYSVMVDVEFGPQHRLFAVSQGDSPGDVAPATPALPDSGELLEVGRDGSLSVVAAGLDLPTSVHFISNAALVVTLNGEVWRIDDVIGRCRRSHR